MVTWADLKESPLSSDHLKSNFFTMIKYQEDLLENAVIKGELDFIKRLLSSLQITDYIQKNCLIRVAKSRGHYNIVEFLLENEVRRDPLDQSILLAAQTRNFKVLNILKEKSDTIIPDDKLIASYDLIYNSYYGHKEAVLYLLQRTDPTLYNNSALLAALKNRHDKLALILLNDPRVAQSTFSKRIIELLKESSNGYVDADVLSAISQDTSRSRYHSDDTTEISQVRLDDHQEKQGFWSKLCFWCCKTCTRGETDDVVNEADEYLRDYDDISLPLLQSD